MEHHVHAWERMAAGVLGNALRGLLHCVVGHDRGAMTPTLVGMLIDIAVITGEVAPTVQLYHELSESETRPSHCDLRRSNG
jgi:hypothetical protein